VCQPPEVCVKCNEHVCQQYTYIQASFDLDTLPLVFLNRPTSLQRLQLNYVTEYLLVNRKASSGKAFLPCFTLYLSSSILHSSLNNLAPNERVVCSKISFLDLVTRSSKKILLVASNMSCPDPELSMA